MSPGENSLNYGFPQEKRQTISSASNPRLIVWSQLFHVTKILIYFIESVNPIFIDAIELLHSKFTKVDIGVNALQ